MRIARIETAHGGELGLVDGDRFVRMSSLGLELDDLAAVAQRLDELRVRGAEVGGTVGEPLDAHVLAPPTTGASKVLCVGLNYLDHIVETGLDRPSAPLLFSKFPSAMSGPTARIPLDDRFTEQLDYEVELAVVIGREGFDIPAGEALDHVLGYCVANDVSARDRQFADGQWLRGKSADGYCPIGPWLTTADDVGNPQDLALWCRVGEDVRQDSSTSQMVFSVAEIIAFASSSMTLSPGDVILTGTPHGVAMAMDEPGWLQDGDVVRCGIDGLGELANPVAAR